MSINSHINSLAKKRTDIKEKITEESHRPSPNFVLITNLKKQNLALKEEMQRYLTLLHDRTASSSS